MTYTWALIRSIISKDLLAGKMAVAKALHEKVCWPSTFVFDSASHIYRPLKMPHRPVSSWMSTLTKQRVVYEAVRTEALSFTAASGPHPPDSHLQDSTCHPRNEVSDVEMNEAGRDTEDLEELHVGASLLAEGDFIHDNEQRQSLPGENGSKRDAYVRDFEALDGFLTSATAAVGEMTRSSNG
jgi:hypothetical protein